MRSSEEFWVLKRTIKPPRYLPDVTEEFADECNCSSLSANHVCTWYSPEKAVRFDTKEFAMLETRLINLGFTPAKYRMTLEEIKDE